MGVCVSGTADGFVFVSMCTLGTAQRRMARPMRHRANATVWNTIGNVDELSLDSLPMWESRPLMMHDVSSGQAVPFTNDLQVEYWALVDTNGAVIRMISNPHKLPSKAYRNPTPRSFVSSAMTKARDMFRGVGDVCILSVSYSAASTQLLVTLKCPETFELASHAGDKFGTTLVLCNSYKQEGGMKVAAGAIRFVCTNGCIFGEHTCIGWNHRDPEDAVEQKVEHVLSTHVVKAREYMAQLQTTRMAPIQLVTSDKDKDWHVRRTFQDMESRLVMAIAQLPITWCQKKLVLQEVHTIQEASQGSLTKYDFWNACTAVASHHLKDSNKTKDSKNSMNTIEARRDTMRRQVNRAFANGAIVDEVIAWDDAKFAQEKVVWVQRGWDNNQWTPMGPIFQVAKKTKRDADDRLSADNDDDRDGVSPGVTTNLG